MGVTLKISKPPNREHFTSGESVSGSVELTACRLSNISSVFVYLEGSLHTAVRQAPSCQESSFRKSDHLLFSRHKNLSTCLEGAIGQQRPVAAPRRVTLPFMLEFPAFVCDEPGKAQQGLSSLTDLPPSIEAESSNLKISVIYFVRIFVRRTGAFNPNITTKCNIAFRPLSAAQACLETHTSLLKTVSWLSSTAPVPAIETDLPEYTPSVRFEVEIPPCKAIFPGEHIQLGMALAIPPELRHLFALIWITNIRIRLRMITSATIGCNSEKHQEYAECCKVEGSMPLALASDVARIVIPSELWEHHTYPSIAPSFKIAGVRRDHQLETVIEFAWLSKGNVHMSTIVNWNDIIVESDAQLVSTEPPPYE